jgi:hypothetical protein
MAYDDITNQQVQVRQQQQGQIQQQRGGYPDDGYGYDPYPVPGDPYMYRPPQQNANMITLLALLDSKIKNGEDLGDIKGMMVILIDNVARIPNIEMMVVKGLNRKMADIIALSECQGTKYRVLSKMTSLIFEISSLKAYGGAPLTGITSVSSLITTRQQADQKVTYPQEPQKRTKLFGVF